MHGAPDNLGPLAQRQHRPIIELLLLAAPTVAQMASYSVMQFIDIWMLAHIGPDEPAAAGNSGGFAFSLISFGMGVLFVVNTLVSQEFGRRDYPSCGKYLWQGIWWSVAFFVLLLPVIPLSPALFGLLGHTPRLTELEVTYFQIVVLGSLFKLLATALGQFLLAVNRPGTVLVSAATGVSVNVIAAAVLIFGRLGLPGMGVAGAAWAQNIGTLVEMLVLVGFALQPGVRRVFNVLDWPVRRIEMRNLVVVGTPSGIQVVTEVLAWVLFSAWVIGQFGTLAMAANTFNLRYMTVGFMPCFGLATAVTALVGRYIGMGRPDIARRRAHLGFVVAGVYTALCGVFFYVFRHDLIRVFSDDPEILRLGATLMIFAALYQVFDAMYIVYNGALRGAGDTLMPAVVTGTLCWSVSVAGGYLIARHLGHLGVAGPWTAALLYGIVLGIYMLWRFERGGWKSIHIDNEPSPLEANPTKLSSLRPSASGN